MIRSCSGPVSRRGDGSPRSEESERVRVEGAHQRLVHDAARVVGDAGLDAVAQGRGAAAAERQHQDALGVDALGDAGGDRLDQGGGLAGAGAADHQQRAVDVRGDVALQFVGAEGGHGGAGAPDQAVGGPAHRGVCDRGAHGI
jgi:hypothetical protein